MQLFGTILVQIVGILQLEGAIFILNITQYTWYQGCILCRTFSIKLSIYYLPIYCTQRRTGIFYHILFDWFGSFVSASIWINNFTKNSILIGYLVFRWINYKFLRRKPKFPPPLSELIENLKQFSTSPVLQPPTPGRSPCVQLSLNTRLQFMSIV